MLEAFWAHWEHIFEHMHPDQPIDDRTKRDILAIQMHKSEVLKHDMAYYDVA